MTTKVYGKQLIHDGFVLAAVNLFLNYLDGARHAYESFTLKKEYPGGVRITDTPVGARVRWENGLRAVLNGNQVTEQSVLLAQSDNFEIEGAIIKGVQASLQVEFTPSAARPEKR